MNLPIAQALMLTCAGNAFLRGGDLTGFWPDARVFAFSKSCEFRIVEGDRDDLVAADPLAWFETLRGARGVRLHHAPRPRETNQTLAIEDRKLAGFVGGGPAWIIEVVGAGPSALWQGFNRLGDRSDPDRKIWLDTYLRVGETTPQDFSVQPLAQASAHLVAALVKIEALARRLQFTPFDEIFAAAQAALHATTTPVDALSADFVCYGDFDLDQQRMLVAASGAYVFGGMGSWNDIVLKEPLKADYERISENLYTALNDAVCALANSTYA